MANKLRNPNIIAFVWRNNLFLWDNGKVTSITIDGGPEVFHGVPDWVYEEEVLENRSALWFSPDGEYIAFLSFDDSQVPIYTVPSFMHGKKYPSTYPVELKVRYPKTGAPNPIVKTTVFAVAQPEKLISIPISRLYGESEFIIGELAWITDKHSKLLIRSFNRIQTHTKDVIYAPEENYLKVIRERKATDGYIENVKSIKYAGIVNGTDSYLDISDIDGWSHLWLYPTDVGNATQVTFGNWEVRRVDRIDKKSDIVYYTSAKNHPSQSNPTMLYLRTGQNTALTPVEPLAEKKFTDGDKNSVDGSTYTEISVSPDSKYVVCSYKGTGQHVQKLFGLESNPQMIRDIELNTDFKQRMARFDVPKSTLVDLQHPSGFNLSSRIQFPPTFDPTKKYPILLTPYGGPNSQEVTDRDEGNSFKAFVSSSPHLEYVTFTVDNRGTGFRGRAFRQQYYKNMEVTAKDQVWAARWLADTYDWVDRDRIGIWGWSHGGYLAAKTVELNDPIIAFAIATAPTYDQRLYDSIYTERYLGLPSDSAEAYDRAAVRNTTGFKNLRGSILFQHGTADDNVHFQHSLGLVDLLMQSRISPEQFQVQYFPDSEHSIRYGKDSEFLYKQIALKLLDEKHRDPKSKRHYWDDGVLSNRREVNEIQRNALQTEGLTHKSKWKIVQGE
jgi:dipeptidyl-peptidase 4